MAFALLGACGFATAILVGSDLESLGPIWIVATGRAVGVVVVTVPLALARALPRPERGLWPWLLGSPAFDAAGFAALLLATQDGVAVPAVIANMSVVLLSLIAMVVFDERLGRVQWLGVATTLVASPCSRSPRPERRARGLGAERVELAPHLVNTQAEARTPLVVAGAGRVVVGLDAAPALEARRERGRGGFVLSHLVPTARSGADVAKVARGVPGAPPTSRERADQPPSGRGPGPT